MRTRTVWGLLVAAAVAWITQAAVAADVKEPKRGTVSFKPAAGEAELPERFQMKEHTFEYVETPMISTSPKLRISKVTFPSPVVTPHANNNTVHCELFCPTTEGKKPGVIVLHILGGDFDLSRVVCRSLASKGIVGLFMIMPYYGPRGEPGIEREMISVSPEETVEGMTQAVLDVRQATSFLEANAEVDPAQLGISGISLGGITGALSFTQEHRLKKACLMLAGGDMGEVAWTSTEMAPVREKWVKSGGTKESLFKAMKVVDPVTYAKPMPGRMVLMLNASEDEVVPPACTKVLWRAFGEPEIVWWKAGHYSAINYIPQGVFKCAKFFQPGYQPPAAATEATGAQSTAK